MTADQVAIGEGGGAGKPHWLNEERVRVYSWMIVVIFGIVYAVWLARSVPDLVDPRGKPFGYDFMAYWSTARLVLAGHAATAFDGDAITAVQHMAVPFLPNIWFPWHYPPIFMLFVAPLGLMPYPAALAAFTLGSAAIWAAFVRRLFADPRAWIVAAAMPAGLINLLDGQNAFVTAALAGFALLCLDRRPVLAGVLIGLLAVKPHLAVLFPLALLAERRWATIASAAATVLALATASLLAFGWQTWAVFLRHLPVSQAMADAGAVPWGTMPSPYVFALSLGATVDVARVSQVLVALFAAVCVWRAWRHRGASFEAKAATLMAASLLVSPYLFYYDLTWAAVAIAWLAALGLRGGFYRGEREIFLFAWLAPAVMPPVQMLTGVQVGFPAVLLLLLAAVRRAAPLREAERRRWHRAVSLLREARWLTRERLMRWGVALALMSLAIVTVQVIVHTRAGLTDAHGEQLGSDFVNYWAGARAAAAGQASLPYDLHNFYAFEQATTGAGSEFKYYSYPPIAMLLTLPLALLPFVPALVAWIGVGTAWCVALLCRLLPWREAVVAMLAAPAALLNLVSGQNGCFTAGLFAGGLMVLQRRPLLAGFCFGCLAYKPQMAVLVPVALLAGRQWRAVVAAGVTVAVLGLASLAFCGVDAWAGFLRQAALQRHLLEYGTSFWHRMPTVFTAMRVLGATIPTAYVAQVVSGILAVLAVARLWRSRAAFEVKAAVLTVATFLATPYAWDYDAVVLLFAAAWLGRAGLRDGFLAWERVAIVALLVFPLVTMVLTKAIGVQLAPLALWLVLLVLLRRAGVRFFGAAGPVRQHVLVVPGEVPGL
jgi:hypothetical protein